MRNGKSKVRESSFNIAKNILSPLKAWAKEESGRFAEIQQSIAAVLGEVPHRNQVSDWINGVHEAPLGIGLILVEIQRNKTRKGVPRLAGSKLAQEAEK